jgi:hypothetical protein
MSICWNDPPQFGARSILNPSSLLELSVHTNVISWQSVAVAFKWDGASGVAIAVGVGVTVAAGVDVGVGVGVNVLVGVAVGL